MTIQEIVELFEQLELHLINSLKRNLIRHRRQEQDEGGKDGVPEKWEAWQSAKLRDIRRFRRENEKILGEYMPTIEEETERMLREQYAEGGATGFFGSSDPKLQSLIHEMQHNEARVKQGCLRYMNDVYRKTIVTMVVIAVFAVLALKGSISADNVMIVVSTVIAFYFGTQHEKKT